MHPGGHAYLVVAPARGVVGLYPSLAIPPLGRTACAESCDVQKRHRAERVWKGERPGSRGADSQGLGQARYEGLRSSPSDRTLGCSHSRLLTGISATRQSLTLASEVSHAFRRRKDGYPYCDAWQYPQSPNLQRVDFQSLHLKGTLFHNWKNAIGNCLYHTFLFGRRFQPFETEIVSPVTRCLNRGADFDSISILDFRIADNGSATNT